MRSRKIAKPKPPPMLHRGKIRDRGWTTKLMAQFLPAPEGQAAYRNKHVPLWSQATIESRESMPTFQAEFELAAKRKEAAAKALATKLAALDAWIDGLEIELPDLDPAELVRLACRHYNDRALDRAERRHRWDDWDHFREATSERDPKFLARIVVNMLRHATDYEQYLNDTFGRVGTDRAYGRIKARVLDAIAAKYPGLAEECGRQKGEAT